MQNPPKSSGRRPLSVVLTTPGEAADRIPAHLAGSPAQQAAEPLQIFAKLVLSVPDDISSAFSSELVGLLPDDGTQPSE